MFQSSFDDYGPVEYLGNVEEEEAALLDYGNDQQSTELIRSINLVDWKRVVIIRNKSIKTTGK